MPKIKNLSRWVFRRIKNVGDAVAFKTILDALYIKRIWKYANDVFIVTYMESDGKRVLVLIRSGLTGKVEYKVFLSLLGAIYYIESRFPRDAYIYYYSKPKKVEAAENV